MVMSFQPNENNLKIYNKLPIIAQNAACSAKGFQLKQTRFNKDFFKTLRAFNSRRTYSYDEICAYRDEQLRKIIHYAYDNTIYYHNLFKENEIDWREIKGVEDLKKIPITSKDSIISHYNEIQVNSYKKERWAAHTSGTTGAGLQFYTTPESSHAQWACYWRAWEELGIEYGEWCANFGNKLIVPITQNEPPFWRVSYPGHQIYFSGFHENSMNLGSYYNCINSKKIRWIHGFPSLLTALATYMNENSLHFKHIKWVTTAAETLLPGQIKEIRNAFGVSPVQVYGQTEEVAVFHQDRFGNLLVDEDFSAVEFIEQKDGEHLVVGTNLYNYAFPFIRYSTKDTVTLPDIKIKNNRRIISSIDGRVEDYIYMPDGTKIGKFYHIFEDTPGFAEVQLHQNEDYSITIFAVKRYNDIKEDQEKATKLLKLSLGDSVSFNFEYVDRVPRTKSNKVRFIVSDVKR